MLLSFLLSTKLLRSDPSLLCLSTLFTYLATSCALPFDTVDRDLVVDQHSRVMEHYFTSWHRVASAKVKHVASSDVCGVVQRS